MRAAGINLSYRLRPYSYEVSRNLRKVNLLLRELENAGKSVDYYALDLSREELQRTLAQLPAYEHVRAHGLLGTYDDGREWLKLPSISTRQKCILSLGSSIGMPAPCPMRQLSEPDATWLGNFDREEAAAFLKDFAEVLNPGDKMLIGVDHCDNPAKV